jgi:hypothetical protein
VLFKVIGYDPYWGSTASVRVVLDGLPSTNIVGRLPTIGGWQPALPG